MSQRKRPAAKASSSKRKSAKTKAPPASRVPHETPAVLTVLNVHAAGIDVHADMHMVCVPAERVASHGEDTSRAGPPTFADLVPIPAT